MSWGVWSIAEGPASVQRVAISIQLSVISYQLSAISFQSLNGTEVLVSTFLMASGAKLCTED
jgi:hypothetical protein